MIGHYYSYWTIAGIIVRRMCLSLLLDHCRNRERKLLFIRSFQQGDFNKITWLRLIPRSNNQRCIELSLLPFDNGTTPKFIMGIPAIKTPLTL